MNGVADSTKCLILLSEIMTVRESGSASSSVRRESRALEQLSRVAACLSQEELVELGALANSHHVTMRTFPALRQMMTLEGNSHSAEWIDNAIEKERARIQNA